MNTSFGILGGDKRQLYLARSLLQDEYVVYICGFEMSGDTAGLTEVSLESVIEQSDNIVLPLPATRDGCTIFAPYSREEIPVNEVFLTALKNKNVYGGYMSRLLTGSALWQYVNVGDYYLREELTISNAIPTAEGAIGIAIGEFPGILCGSICLITGYGRIGKILTKSLMGLGAQVHVAARKNKDFAMVRAMGAKALRYSELMQPYDIIFNTVPDTVLTAQILGKQTRDTLLIELASLPGGIDRKAAALQGIRIVDGQSLPGKVAPKAAAEFMKEAIYNMMEE